MVTHYTPLRAALVLILSLTLTAGLAGCEEESAAEKAAEDVSDTMDEAGDELEDATGEAQDRVDETRRRAEDTAENAKDKMDDDN